MSIQSMMTIRIVLRWVILCSMLSYCYVYFIIFGHITDYWTYSLDSTYIVYLYSFLRLGKDGPVVEHEVALELCVLRPALHASNEGASLGC